MKINVRTIPGTQQRYETLGDWWFENLESPNDEIVLEIRVSMLRDWRKEMCIALHEQFEALECLSKGISQKDVDQFDMNWKPGSYEEPGDDPKAPYFWPHQHAKVIEKHLANCLEIESWDV